MNQLMIQQEKIGAGPGDFPVTWPEPGDEKRFWTQARMHAPGPTPALIFALLLETHSAGISQALARYGLPFTTFAFRRLNTYVYSTMIRQPLAPEAFHAALAQGEARLAEISLELGTRWHKQWLPAIQAHLDYWERELVAGRTIAELVEQLNDAIARAIDLWDIHFQITLPLAFAFQRFESFYLDLFPDKTKFDALTLLTGFDNKSLERDRALWDLGQQAAALPAVTKIFSSQVATGVLASLEQEPEGRVFLARLQTFLSQFGFDGQPPWLLDPTPAIELISEYMKQGERDLPAEMAALSTAREAAVAEARAALANYPAPVRQEFERALKAAQEANFLAEEHAYWIDQRGFYHLLQSAFRLGGALAGNGQLADPQQVLLLSLDELLEIAASGAPGQPLAGRAGAEMGRWGQVTPPPVLGQPPAGPPPDSPLLRGIAQFFGTPPEPAAAPNELRGHAGSPGTVRGQACVVTSVNEARARLAARQILVAPATSPIWTPFFAIAAGVVTDTGGVLCHTACVAREYGIPAVVGTQRAVATIPDGALIEVDGADGLVRILAEA